eukprot:TRINITY_DN6302_c0_g1_i1.p3 TRINITY_DN6302_c0_g1~~TRINITY_DN6302_c0_g1_i1.p3  ORF type:complete len:51 (-),score=13.34 TRINITY_DN6302_c0_g1_i1:433-585(-)
MRGGAHRKRKNNEYNPTIQQVHDCKIQSAKKIPASIRIENEENECNKLEL